MFYHGKDQIEQQIIPRSQFVLLLIGLMFNL